jgi:hypothetical protein
MPTSKEHATAAEMSDRLIELYVRRDERCGTTTGKRLAISNMKSIAWRSCVTNFSPASGDARAWGRSWWLSDPPSKKAVEPFADHAVALASEGLQTWAIINCDIPLA